MIGALLLIDNANCTITARIKEGIIDMETRVCRELSMGRSRKFQPCEHKYVIICRNVEDSRELPLSPSRGRIVPLTFASLNNSWGQIMIRSTVFSAMNGVLIEL